MIIIKAVAEMIIVLFFFIFFPPSVTTYTDPKRAHAPDNLTTYFLLTLMWHKVLIAEYTINLRDQGKFQVADPYL